MTNTITPKGKPAPTAASEARNIRSRFANTLKSGPKALAEMSACVDHIVKHGDTTVFAHMLYDAKRAEPSLVPLMRRIFNAVYVGAQYGLTKDKRPIVKIKDATLSNSAPVKLAALVHEGKSIRSVDVKDAFAIAGPAPKSFDVVLGNRAKATAKFIVEQGKGQGLEAFIAALKSEVASQKVTASKAN